MIRALARLVGHLQSRWPVRSGQRTRRLAAARTAADQAHALTGWDHAHLVRQTLEDTCAAHAVFCCPRCFATGVPARS
jgi:hypothetical protein